MKLRIFKLTVRSTLNNLPIGCKVFSIKTVALLSNAEWRSNFYGIVSLIFVK